MEEREALMGCGWWEGWMDLAAGILWSQAQGKDGYAEAESVGPGHGGHPNTGRLQVKTSRLKPSQFAKGSASHTGPGWDSVQESHLSRSPLWRSLWAVLRPGVI